MGRPFEAWITKRLAQAGYGVSGVVLGGMLRGDGTQWRMGDIRPTLGRMSLGEAELMLQGLYLVDLDQMGRQGVPSVSDGLHTRQLRYIRRDKNEHWKNAREVWQGGGGDCEDLAAAVAAGMTLRGVKAHPVVYRSRPAALGRPGMAHAVVKIDETGELVDPSRTGGMDDPERDDSFAGIGFRHGPGWSWQ